MKSLVLNTLDLNDLPVVFDTSRIIFVRRPTVTPPASAKLSTRGMPDIPCREVCAECLEMKKIQELLEMTIAEFTAEFQELEISIYRMTSYLYGRVLKVPKNVINHARLLKDRGNPLLQERQRRFGEMTIADIVDNWASQLGVTANNGKGRTAIGVAVKANSITVLRWKTAKIIPTLKKILEYDDNFKAFITKRPQK